MVNTVETTYLPGAIDSDAEPPWYTELNLGGREIKFKIDTGADVSVISRKRYHKLGLRLKLHQTNAVLRCPGGTMACKGQFVAIARIRDRPYALRIFVVESNTENLLRRETASRMGLVKRLDKIERAFGELNEKPVDCTPVKIQLKKNSPTVSTQQDEFLIPFSRRSKKSSSGKRKTLICEVHEDKMLSHQRKNLTKSPQ